jgi:phage/plasmid-like protein (TIGR03299 family)
MSHQFESGFFVAQPAWHQLGTVLSQPPTTAAAIRQSGLDWRVLEEPLYQITGEEQTAVLRKNLIRDRDQRLLGTVNADYVPLQNQDAFQWFDPLLQQGKIQLDAAGSLQNGARVWILARITGSEAEVCHDDWVRPYLLLHNSHNGSTAVWLQFTPVRVVCMNTLAGAAHHRFGDLWQRKAICLPHALGLQQQLDRIRDVLDLTHREFQCNLAEFKAMANQEINSELLACYMGNVLGTRSPLQHPAWHQLAENFAQGLGNRGKTLWDAYNAVTEWLDHQYGANPEERLLHSWFGAGDRLRRRAHQVAVDMAQHPSRHDYFSHSASVMVDREAAHSTK